MKTIKIYTPIIKLDALLKFAAMTSTGGEAKALIQEGNVMLNGTICTERGKKIRHDDVITVNGEEYLIQLQTDGDL